MLFRGSHILSTDQFTLGDLQRLFAVAQGMEPYAARRRTTRVLEGAILGNLFFEPSTRSRISFGAAFNRLGGSVRDTTGFQFSSMAKGESLYDTSRVVSGYVDIIVMRHPTIGSVREFAAATHIPVISGGDGAGEHPTQALLDLYTIRKELKRDLTELRGMRIALVGDLKFGRTVHSLIKLLSLLEHVHFTLVAPRELQLPDDLAEEAKRRGHSLRATPNLYEGISNVDVIYTTRLQQERFTSEAEAERFRGSYSITNAVYTRYCGPGTVLMHPLPRDSRAGAMELHDDLNANPQLAIFRQADNGIPVRMALFALVLGVEDKVEASARNVNWYVPARIDVE
ncbi:MAG: aspartate carbamoyltransferase [Acidobacteriaceae bacterium]|nr:aspartate carbamoyltransferase [Acidobacteriaceae bacterium]